MLRRLFFFLLTGILSVTFVQCGEDKKKKDNPQSEFKKENNETLTGIPGLDDDLQKQFEKDLSELKEEKAKEESEEVPDDGSWVILINDKKVSKAEFESQYNKFRKMAPVKVSKKNYVNIYLQNYLFNQNAKRYFSNKNRQVLLNFVRKQAVLQKYFSENVQNSPIKNPSSKELYTFYQTLITQKGYEHLKLKKHRKKIIAMYKVAQSNKNYMFFEQSIKGQYRIVMNDEWEEGLIEKYISGKYDKKKALGSQSKKYWLYKILIGKPKSVQKKETDKKVVARKKENKEPEKTQIDSINKKKADQKLVEEKSAEVKLEEKTPRFSKETTQQPADPQKLEKKLDEVIAQDKSRIESPVDFKPATPKNNNDSQLIAQSQGDSSSDEADTEEIKVKTPASQDNGSDSAKKESDSSRSKVAESSASSDNKSALRDEEKEKPLKEEYGDLFAKKGVDYQNAIYFCIKDVEQKMSLMAQTNMNPILVSQFKKNPQVRKQVINRYLIEELVYRQLKNKNLLNSGKYREISEMAAQNFMMRYYMENVLKLRSQAQKRQYVLDFMNTQKIRMSEKYFE